MRLPAWSRTVLPFVPFVAGIALATWRFRARDPLGGLLIGEAGTVLLIALAIALSDRTPRAEVPAAPEHDGAHRARGTLASAGAPHDRAAT